MRETKYKVIGKFSCCGNSMVTVIIEGKAACVMPELEYKRIIRAERKFGKKNRRMVV